MMVGNIEVSTSELCGQNLYICNEFFDEQDSNNNNYHNYHNLIMSNIFAFASNNILLTRIRSSNHDPRPEFDLQTISIPGQNSLL
jgi:hypothetical protein